MVEVLRRVELWRIIGLRVVQHVEDLLLLTINGRPELLAQERRVYAELRHLCAYSPVLCAEDGELVDAYLDDYLGQLVDLIHRDQFPPSGLAA